MNNERNNTTAGGIGFCGLLAVAFIVLFQSTRPARGATRACPYSDDTPNFNPRSPRGERR